MKKFTVKIVMTGIECRNETEALHKFWSIVDDSDYAVRPEVEEEK